jgi:pimeloyl-ACP methyl ester carboxylesterase
MKKSVPVYPRPLGARKKGVAHSRHSESPGAHATHGYVKSFDGTRLFYSVEGTGRPLVFCYGLVCSSLHWTYQIEYFRHFYQTIWIDYRGHQNSESPANRDSLTLENIAKDLGVVLDELGVSESVILGHSMGVNVVLDYYRLRPHQVAGMILANGTAKRPLETLFSRNVLEVGFRILKQFYKRSPKLFGLLWKAQKGNPIARTLATLGGFNPHLTPQADIELYVNQVAEMDPAILMHLIEHYDSYDATSWLHTVQAPTLIVSGENDRLIPLEQQELLRQLIPQSQLEVIRHGSHCPQMDLPDLVNLKIEKFLESIGYRRSVSSSPRSHSRGNLRESVSHQVSTE